MPKRYSPVFYPMGKEGINHICGGLRGSALSLVDMRWEAVFRRERMPVSIDRTTVWSTLFAQRRNEVMKKTNTKKLALAGVYCAVAVVGSLFSFPVLGSKCAPVQHMVNILCAITLGPVYGVASAFAASLIRNLFGLGSLMAFPGSMFGALLSGIAYSKTKNIPVTLVGEVFGTAILGGLCAYPVAIFLMGKNAAELAFYVYIIPFLISTAGGAIISAVLIYSLKKSGILQIMQESLNK